MSIMQARNHRAFLSSFSVSLSLAAYRLETFLAVSLSVSQSVSQARSLGLSESSVWTLYAVCCTDRVVGRGGEMR